MNYEDVKSVENSRLSALLNKDVSTLKSLLSEHLTYIHSNGKVDHYGDVIEKANSSFRYTKLERKNLNVQMVDNKTAIMTGVLEVEYKVNELDSTQKMNAMVTQVWVNNEGVIQLFAYHVSKLD